MGKRKVKTIAALLLVLIMAAASQGTLRKIGKRVQICLSTDKNIQDEEKDAKVTDGLAIRDSSLDDADEDTDQWLKSNGVTK